MRLPVVSAIVIAAVHATAPDHWLPFVAIGRALRWSPRRLALVTFAGGVGHVGSSIVLGFLGIALGLALSRLKNWEAVRGEVAGWLLIAFGVVYALWGVWKAKRGEVPTKHEVVTTWALIALLVLGPCEPLIPLMFVSVQYGWHSVWAVALAFSAVTILTMLAEVLLVYGGVLFIPTKRLEEWTHAIAGAVIALTGILVMVFEL